MIAHRKRLAVDDSVDRAKSAVVQRRLPAILDLERRLFEGTFRKSELLTLRVVDLVARWRGVVAVGVELFRGRSV